jgi:glycosyl transferase, family 25
MNIILINLARAADRLQKMAAQFATLGTGYELLTATDGRSLTDIDRALVDNEKRKMITAYPLTDNEIGCWISHRRAMERLVASQEAMATIVEDDVTLSPDFPKVLEAIEEHAGSFDIIDLHRNFRRGEIFVPCRPLIPHYSLGRIGYTHMNANAYVVSRQGAQQFLSYATRFVHAFDKELHRYWANGLDLYGLEHPVAVQEDGSYSYIDETRGQERPTKRRRYADADLLYYRARRRLVRLSDSVRKRLAFPGYVKKGKMTQ